MMRGYQQTLSIENRRREAGLRLLVTDAAAKAPDQRMRMTREKMRLCWLRPTYRQRQNTSHSESSLVHWRSCVSATEHHLYSYRQRMCQYIYRPPRSEIFRVTELCPFHSSIPASSANRSCILEDGAR